MGHVWGFFGRDGQSLLERANESSDCALARESVLPVGCAGGDGDALWYELSDALVIGVGRLTFGGATEGEAAASLVGAYRRMGSAACAGLRGSFALMLFDCRTDSALFAVDRIGTHPLYVAEAAGGIVSSTRLSQVAAKAFGTPALNPQALFDYLYFHTVPAPDTIYQGVRRLLPGEAVIADRHGLRQQTYWRPSFVEAHRPDRRGTAAELRTRLRSAVRRTLDGRATGTFLSGGIDSTTITGVLREVTGEQPRTFFIGFDTPGYDETEYARLAAARFDAEHHEYFVRPLDVVNAVPAIAREYEQPFGNASVVPAYYCARLARQAGVKLLLGGDGGDELFGGNARYGKQWRFALYQHLPGGIRRRLLEPLLDRCPPLGAIRKLASYVRQARTPLPDRMESYNLLRRLGPETILDGDFLAAVDPGRPLRLIQESFWSVEADNVLNRMLAKDLRFTLADDDLPKVQGACALAGVDVAFPMLDEEVVELSLRLPASWKVHRQRLRPFFKEALADLLPPEILAKSKHGFGLPFGVWLREDRDLHELADDSLSRLAGRGIVRRDFLKGLLANRLPQHAAYYGTLVWVLIMLEQWFQAHDPVTDVRPPGKTSGVRAEGSGLGS